MQLRRCLVAAVVAVTVAAVRSGVGIALSAAVAAAPLVPVQFEAGELVSAVSDAALPPEPLAPAAVTAPPPQPAPATATAPPPKPAPATATAPPRKPAPTAVTAPPRKPVPTPSTTSPATRRAAAAVPNRMAQVTAILDASGWDWRGAGVTVRLGDHPDVPGHWGVYDSRTREVWVGRGAFARPARLRYVVLHEAAHGWQYTSKRFSTLYADMALFGHASGRSALEAGADCVAALWGATTFHYWNCPASARSVTALRLAGDWS